MTRSHLFVTVLVAGLLLGLACVSSAWAGPATVTWNGPPTVARAELLAGGLVGLGASRTPVDSARDGMFEYQLVLEIAQVGDRAESNVLRRSHLVLMRRRVDDPDPSRPWEQVGGQIDDMGQTLDGDTGVQTARLSCRLARPFGSRCWVAYTKAGRLTLAQLVEVGPGYSWQRVLLGADVAQGVGQLALTTFGGGGFVAWAQPDRDHANQPTVKLARVSWADGMHFRVYDVLSLGSGDRLQIAGDALMVYDDHEIRLYDVFLAVSHVERPAMRFARAQATGRVLLAASPQLTPGRYVVAEPAPGGTLVHDLHLTLSGAPRGEEVGRYRFDNPAWLPNGAAPMALTAEGEQGWMVVGAPGWPGPLALVEITPRRDRRLGALVYEIPELPAPTGFATDGMTTVVPEVIGAVNATIAGGPPTVDLFTLANLIRGNHPDNTHPFGHRMLLSARVITKRASD